MCECDFLICGGRGAMEALREPSPQSRWRTGVKRAVPAPTGLPWLKEDMDKYRQPRIFGNKEVKRIMVVLPALVGDCRYLGYVFTPEIENSRFMYRIVKRLLEEEKSMEKQKKEQLNQTLNKEMANDSSSSSSSSSASMNIKPSQKNSLFSTASGTSIHISKEKIEQSTKALLSGKDFYGPVSMASSTPSILLNNDTNRRPRDHISQEPPKKLRRTEFSSLPSSKSTMDKPTTTNGNGSRQAV